MMDCKDTKVFYSEWRRMCFTRDKKIKNFPCPMLECGATSCCEDCLDGVFHGIEKAIAVVQEWSDANPIKTRLSVLKEQYPNLKIYNGRVAFCAGELYGFLCGERTSCDDCWNEPIEGGEGNG